MTATLRFWGVRGSIPCPGPGTVRYGGNTPCVAIDTPGHLLICDAGTGLRALGRALVERGGPVEADLLLSHTHWDHIQGLPFFFPAYDAGSRIRIHGPRQPRGLGDTLARQMAWETFPIPASAQGGIEAIHEVDTGAFQAGPWRVHATPLCHPGPTLGYRLERHGVAAVAYVTDNELAGNAHGVARDWRSGLVDFLRGVHTLIHDSTWPESRLPAVAGWGHSSAAQAVALALEAQCRRLVLFHHDPDQDDEALDRQLAAAREAGPGLEIEAAVEGETLELEAAE